jgi:hypothetical protein
VALVAVALVAVALVARDQPVARAHLAAALVARAHLAAARPPLEDVTNGNHPRCC